MFEGFLTLCAEHPEAAVATLAETPLGRAASIDLVNRLRRETRRLEVDMRHERDRRVLALQQSLESELIDQGVELAALRTRSVLWLSAWWPATVPPSRSCWWAGSSVRPRSTCRSTSSSSKRPTVQHRHLTRKRGRTCEDPRGPEAWGSSRLWA
jgi:hypothetical protein